MSRVGTFHLDGFEMWRGSVFEGCDCTGKGVEEGP